jgi:hypothetical protein
MDEKNKNQLDRLLADGELGGPEADAIFDRVYAAVASAERARWPARSWLLGGGLSAAAAVLLMLVWPGRHPAGELTARGSDRYAPTLEATCSEGSLAACPISAKLVFVVSGDGAGGFLSAYAEPLDAGAERVWYFSREANSPELKRSGNGTRVFDRAVKLAGSHRPGRYRVHAFLAKRPLTHAEMLASGAGVRILTSIHSDVTIKASR